MAAAARTATNWRSRTFGERLVRPTPLGSEEPPQYCPVDVLASEETAEVVAVYFRALPETQQPEEPAKGLAELYRTVRPRLEVVQVFIPPWVGFCQGRDLDLEGQFSRHFRGVPWYTMPIDDRVKWVRLKHRCRGKVGMLTLLCAHTGKVLHRDASSHLQKDPQGYDFPWLPRLVTSVLSEAVQKGLIAGGLQKGPKVVPYNTLDGYIKGLYFSAHWCPPCKAFTPQLINCYKKIKSRGHKFEVIFVSWDRYYCRMLPRSEESYQSYLESMPWTALPFKNSFSQELASVLDVHGIPSLVLLDSDGSVITGDARNKILHDLDGEFFPWRPKLVNILTDRMAELLYDSPAIVLFLDGDDDEDLEFGETVLSPVAEWVADNCIHLDYQILFFIAIENEVSDSLRSFTKLEEACPLVIAIDFPLNRFSVMEFGAEITEDSVKSLVSGLIADQLSFKPISEIENTN